MFIWPARGDKDNQMNAPTLPAGVAGTSQEELPGAQVGYDGGEMGKNAGPIVSPPLMAPGLNKHVEHV
jgi:hypothetical protein